jgi:hypothetical protein
MHITPGFSFEHHSNCDTRLEMRALRAVLVREDLVSHLKTAITKATTAGSLSVSAGQEVLQLLR